MKTLVIVPCGKKKVWDVHPTAGVVKAENAYIGTLFNLHKQYARLHSNWVILSANYGYIAPAFRIPHSYDVSFTRKSSNLVTVGLLTNQIGHMNLWDYDHIIGLGGKEYREIIAQSFVLYDLMVTKKLDFPFAGLSGIGSMQQAIKKAINKLVKEASNV